MRLLDQIYREERPGNLTTAVITSAVLLWGVKVLVGIIVCTFGL